MVFSSSTKLSILNMLIYFKSIFCYQVWVQVWGSELLGKQQTPTISDQLKLIGQFLEFSPVRLKTHQCLILIGQKYLLSVVPRKFRTSDLHPNLIVKHASFMISKQPFLESLQTLIVFQFVEQMVHQTHYLQSCWAWMRSPLRLQQVQSLRLLQKQKLLGRLKRPNGSHDR